MIAVAKIGGHQAIVEVGDTLEVDKIDMEVGKKVLLETLLVSEKDGKNFKVGTPLLDGVKVEAKVIEHGRGDKIRIFKMKPRKRYRRLQGHRQDYTVIEITAIGATKKESSSATVTKDKKEPVKKAASKAKAPAKRVAPKKAVASKSAKATADKKKAPAKKKVAKSTEKK